MEVVDYAMVLWNIILVSRYHEEEALPSFKIDTKRCLTFPCFVLLYRLNSVFEYIKVFCGNQIAICVTCH